VSVVTINTTGRRTPARSPPPHSSTPPLKLQSFGSERVGERTLRYRHPVYILYIYISRLQVRSICVRLAAAAIFNYLLLSFSLSPYASRCSPPPHYLVSIVTTLPHPRHHMHAYILYMNKRLCVCVCVCEGVCKRSIAETGFWNLLHRYNSSWTRGLWCCTSQSIFKILNFI